MQKLTLIGRSYGKSMAPLINPGDKLYIKKVENKDIKVGDIVLFYFKNKCISHRVIAKRNNEIVAKGDNVLLSKEIVKRNEILGKIIRIDGKYGKIDLERALTRIVQYYFLMRSLIFFSVPFYWYKPLLLILRGRKILVQIISYN